MKFDVFFSICQTPVDGQTPSERVMFKNFFDQVRLADDLGFGTAWVAETHLSCQIQKANPGAVIPHFQGEIGLNTDILQVAHKIFGSTKRIHVGSAIRNILCNGGPLAHAEAIRTFLTLHGLNDSEVRCIDIGFAAGRFPFSNVPYGVVPRNAFESAAWPVLKNKIFQEATEIFLRVLRGDIISSKDIQAKTLRREDFRTDEDWEKVRSAAASVGLSKNNASYEVPPYWVFDKVGVIPFEAPLGLLRLTIGTHDPETQRLANSILPCRVFNLSITPGEKIEETHERMAGCFRREGPGGGVWRREYMPRTALVFVNGDKRLSPAAQSAAARAAAVKANQNYWRAMEGTLDPSKVESAVNNTIHGSPAEVAHQIREKYHPEDRLMLWFDFNNHDNEAVKASMRTFMEDVAPLL